MHADWGGNGIAIPGALLRQAVFYFEHLPHVQSGRNMEPPDAKLGIGAAGSAKSRFPTRMGRLQTLNLGVSMR